MRDQQRERAKPKKEPQRPKVEQPAQQSPHKPGRRVLTREEIKAAADRAEARSKGGR